MNIFGMSVYQELPPEIEEDWKKESKERFLPFMKMAMIGGMMLAPSFVIWDYIISPETFWTLFSIRVSLFLAWFVVLGILYLPQAVKYSMVLGCIAPLISITGIGIILANIDNGFVIGLAGAVFQFLFIIILPSFLTLVVTATLMVLSIEAIMIYAQVPLDVFINANFFISAGMLGSIIVGSVLIYSQRKSFLLEKGLLHAKQEAEHANSAKSSFLATMSHEVRTPLNGVLGIVSLLDDTQLDSKQRGFVETIRYSGEALLTILNDILDFSRLEANKLNIEYVEFDISKLVTSVTDLMQSRASEKGIFLQNFISIDIPEYVVCDPTRLRQVLINLISNAIKFTDDGEIRIKVINLFEEGDECRLRFEIQDSGIGIAQEIQDNLFEEFTQADSTISRKYGGTGLGLSICKKIVELLKGKIGVTSKEGEGSTFWFEIPMEVVDYDPMLHRGMYEATDVYRTTEPMNILLAEDNKVNQQVAIGLLEKLKHTVTLAENGQEAVDLCREKDFDIILMDMQMPVMDGLEASREIKALGDEKASIPIIALTANAMRGDDERCLMAGMVDHIEKPVQPVKFYNTIAKHAPAHIKSDTAQPANETRQSIAGIDKDEAVVDLSILQEIEKSMGKDFAHNFVNENLPELGKYIDRLKDCGSDQKEILHAAHDIKSTAALFGLTNVSALAEAIEIAGVQDSNQQEIDELRERLCNNYDKSIEKLYKVYSIKIAV